MRTARTPTPNGDRNAFWQEKRIGGTAGRRGLDYNAAMGITQVTAAVRNPATPERLWEGLFLVDTGAVDCLVPGKHLEALGLKPRGRRTYALADGSEITLKVTVAKWSSWAKQWVPR